MNATSFLPKELEHQQISGFGGEKTALALLSWDTKEPSEFHEMGFIKKYTN